jgi:hypothetical protein
MTRPFFMRHARTKSWFLLPFVPRAARPAGLRFK